MKALNTDTCNTLQANESVALRAYFCTSKVYVCTSKASKDSNTLQANESVALRALTAHLLEVLTLLALLVQKYKILTQTLRKKEIRHAACAAWCTSVSRGRDCSYCA